jgi:hypothetical protein
MLLSRSRLPSSLGQLPDSPESLVYQPAEAVEPTGEAERSPLPPKTQALEANASPAEANGASREVIHRRFGGDATDRQVKRAAR